MKPETKQTPLPYRYYEFAQAVLEDDWEKATNIMRGIVEES